MKTWRNMLLLSLALGASFLVSACASEDGTTPDCKEADQSDCFTPADGGTRLNQDAGGTTD